MPRGVSEHDLRQRLAANVKKLRKARGLTIEAASGLAGIHPRMWDRIEAGELNTTLRTLVRLGAALTADPGELLAR